MKVFMSWSGQRSKLTAELLYGWVKCVIQAAQPWISSKGIERGALWFSEINNELKDTSVGIICLTQENKNAPWILFESGALAKGLSTNRVCTFLVDLQPPDLQPPLAQFNHTLPNKESMWSLVITLNNGLDNNRLAPDILERVFETYWPQFEEEFAAVIANNPPVTVVAPREEKDILAEILETTRSISGRVQMLEERNLTRDAGVSPARVTRTIRRGLVTPSNESYDSTQAIDINSEGLNLAIDSLSKGMHPETVYMKLIHEHGYPPQVAAKLADSARLIVGLPKNTDS
jgi:hypothetical protein